MRLNRIYVNNIRSITEEVEIDLIEDPNFVRIGGRNGRGKSTVVAIGLKILLGITPAKPHLTKGTNEGHYAVENDKGIFGVSIFKKGNPLYYYELVNGDKGSSQDTVNHNKAIKVIRAHIGFDLDEDFTGALNINENTRLNFVSTNGRTDLAYLRNLIYSEEIEILQEDTKEAIKVNKRILDRNSNEISLQMKARGDIKIVDRNYLQELINYANTLKKQDEYHRELSKEYINLIRSNLLKVKVQNNLTKTAIEGIQAGIKGKVATTIWLDTVNTLAKNEETLLSMQELKESSLKQHYINTKLVEHSLHTLKGGISLIKESSLKQQKLRIGTLDIGDEVRLIKRYIYLNQRAKYEEISIHSTEYSKFILTLKKQELQRGMLEVRLGDSIRGQLEDVLHFFRQLQTQKTIVQKEEISLIILSIIKYLDIKEKLTQSDKELEDLIYKGGRCVLCLKEK